MAEGPRAGTRATGRPRAGASARPDRLGADETRPPHRAAAAPAVRPAPAQVWDNPILWREIRTWAYGRKMLVIRLAYLLLFAAGRRAACTGCCAGGQPLASARRPRPCVPLLLLSLVLVNAQAVTSLTSERDARALDLLLVTDLTPKEFVFGKLGGVFYNTKEMVLLPLLLCVYLWPGRRPEPGEPRSTCSAGWPCSYAFVAVLGIHAGMIYDNSRTAIATSLGTVFFLFVGVATCMRIMVAFSGSFQAQFQPFLAFMLGGGVGLYVALGARNPSTAIGVALVRSAPSPRSTRSPASCWTTRWPCSWSRPRPTASPRPPCWCRRSTSSTWPPAAPPAEEGSGD